MMVGIDSGEVLIIIGLWDIANEYLTDIANCLLLVYGAGKMSVDSKIYKPSKT